MLTALYHPLAQSVALPFLGILLMAPLALKLPNQTWRNANIAVVVGLGILGSYLLTFDFPPFPPRTSNQKFFFLVIAFTIAGIIGDSLPLKSAKPLFQLVGTVSVCLLAMPGVLKEPITLIPMTLGVFLLWHIATSKLAHLAYEQKSGLWYCVFIAMTVSLLAGTNGSLSIAQQSLAIGSCAAALLIYSGVLGQIRPTWILLYVFFGPILLLVSQILLYEATWRFSVLPAFAILFADNLFSKLLGNNYLKTNTYRIILLVICLGNLILCYLLSFLLGQLQDPYY